MMDNNDKAQNYQGEKGILERPNVRNCIRRNSGITHVKALGTLWNRVRLVTYMVK